MPTLFVATNGLSIWTSSDLGQTLARLPSSTGLYSGSRVWALLETPLGLMAGTDSGIYVWQSRDARWIGISSPRDVQLVTALAASPANPDVLLAGTQPGRLFRTEDGGQSWRHLCVDIRPYVSTGFYEDPKSIAPHAKLERPAAQHWTRVTQIVFDPVDPDCVWAGVEIDGAWRSKDGGMSWSRCSSGLQSEDVHGFAVVHNPQRRVLATTNAGLHVSENDGHNWSFQPIESGWQYTRSVVAHASSAQTMFLTNGNGAPGTEGRLFRSNDYGGTWID